MITHQQKTHGYEVIDASELAKRWNLPESGSRHGPVLVIRSHPYALVVTFVLSGALPNWPPGMNAGVAKTTTTKRREDR